MDLSADVVLDPSRDGRVLETLRPYARCCGLQDRHDSPRPMEWARGSGRAEPEAGMPLSTLH